MIDPRYAAVPNHPDVLILSHFKMKGILISIEYCVV
jgi:hypothetical protein